MYRIDWMQCKGVCMPNTHIILVWHLVVHCRGAQEDGKDKKADVRQKTAFISWCN